MLSEFYLTDPATAALTLRHHLIPAMEAFSSVIALQIFGYDSGGDQPLKKRDAPRPSDRGTSLPKRGAEAAKLVRRFSCHTIALPAVSSTPLALGRQERSHCFSPASNMWGESSKGSPVRRADDSMRPHLTRAGMS
jgi:hypothetical protein